MHTDQINHDPAHTVMNTGTAISGRPSMGSWITYGLGSECDDLPGFVVLTSVGRPQPAADLARGMWGSGFLPGRFQGVEFNSQRRPGPLRRATRRACRREQQRDVVDAVSELNRHPRRDGATTRRSTRGSPSTRWPSGCRRACRS